MYLSDSTTKATVHTSVIKGTGDSAISKWILITALFVKRLMSLIENVFANSGLTAQMLHAL
jgi:hypothetical protein